MQFKHSIEFKLRCVHLIKFYGYSLNQVASQFAVGKRSLLKWLRDYENGDFKQPLQSRYEQELPADNFYNEEQDERPLHLRLRKHVKCLEGKIRVLEKEINLLKGAHYQ